MASVLSVTGTTRRRLDAGWVFARADPDRSLEIEDVARADLVWKPAWVPGTVVGAGWDEPNLDGAEFWYRARFVAPSRPYTLRFGGLAPVADVWLEGQHLLSSDDMFVAREVSVVSALGRSVELVIRFGALQRSFRDAGPRARWRTRSIDPSLSRWARTPLFCRTPGLAPRVIPVGPWRPIEIIEHGALEVRSARLAARIDERWGRVFARLLVSSTRAIRSAVLRVGPVQSDLEISTGSAGEARIHGVSSFRNPERWWPHTHGPQPLYPVTIEVDVGGQSVVVDLGKTGFREIEVSSRDGDFGFIVNGVPIFCRGACWLPLDPVLLDAPVRAVDRTLTLARYAGMNMLRAAAQGIYESDYFFDRAAELGILIWQDFLFARLDYPTDSRFLERVEGEARELLDRSERCPALALFCGNSEVEQQAAMLGLDPELGRSALFTRVLPAVVRELRPDVPYLESTPSGGALPFHVDRGPSHYFGVGAHRRPLSDARQSAPRFAAECLAFSNLPEQPLLERLLGADPPGANPNWKSLVPRDGPASWDFEDVRDHYLEALFEIDAARLRASDPERWLELGRIASGEVMARTLAELRRAGSRCRGALVWHLRDIVPGAGCGVIDAEGRPKAAYWYLARACSPIALYLLDEGLNGLRVHAVNDTHRALSAELVIDFLRAGRIRVDRAKSHLALPARSSLELSVDSLLGRFIDPSYAYRFGPPSHDVVVATLTDRVNETPLAEAVWFPLGPPPARRSDLELSGCVRPHPLGFVLSLSSNAFAYAVHVEAKGYDPTDDYFHLAPERRRQVVLRASSSSEDPAAIRVSAANGWVSLNLRAKREERKSA